MNSKTERKVEKVEKGLEFFSKPFGPLGLLPSLCIRMTEKPEECLTMTNEFYITPPKAAELNIGL